MQKLGFPVLAMAIVGVWVLMQATVSTLDVGAAESPLLRAARAGDFDAVETALAAGADPNQADSQLKKTPLHWVALFEGKQSTEEVRHRTAIIQALVRKGADPKRLDASLETPLYRGVWHPDIAEAFVKAGAVVDAGQSSRTPLISAAFLGGEYCFDAAEAMKVLIAAGADVNAQEQGSGWNALITAAIYGCPEMVEALLAAGADPNRRTVLGHTALGAIAHSEQIEREHSSVLSSGPDAATRNRAKELIRRAGGV